MRLSPLFLELASLSGDWVHKFHDEHTVRNLQKLASNFQNIRDSQLRSLALNSYDFV